VPAVDAGTAPIAEGGGTVGAVVFDGTASVKQGRYDEGANETNC